MNLDDLRDVPLEELHDIFERGGPPDENKLRGDMHGAILAGRGPAQGSGWKVAARLAPWAGMWFGDTDEGDGVNHIGYSPLVFERYGFKTRRDGDSLVLDYDVPDNPYALRRLKEHVRHVDGVLLGKAYISIAGREVFVHYYAMVPKTGEIPIV